jgi:serine/threonine protein kinase
MALDTSPPTQLGNYDVVSKIAEGGMGTVYKARNRVTNEVVAIKVIASTTAKNPVLLQRFEREFQAAKVLDHPNVVRAIEYCGTGPHPFLVMEFVDGESIGQRTERTGIIPEAEAVRLIAQVCDGLQRAHKQGLVHRDVKPDNILINQEGVAKLTDMGLVKEVENDMNLTKTGRGLGTPHFMAPEQFRNAKNVDVRGDIYSLGATLYSMVTGEIPFDNVSPLDCWMKKIRNDFPSPKELNPKISDRVDWAIRRAMSAEPNARPSSCREFLEDLTGQTRNTTPTHLKPPAHGTADVWYLVYRDEFGTAHTVKGATDGIRKALSDSLLGDLSTILVSRSKTGPFVQVGTVPEFRDLIVSPAALPSPTVPQRGTPSRLSGVNRVPGADEAVDLGASPSASGASASRSGKNRPPASGTARVEGDTTVHALPPEVVPSQRPKVKSKPAKAKAGFDWTPVVVIVVALASAAVGYVMFAK